MSSDNLKKITRQYVGEIPILQNIAHQMGIREIFLNQIGDRRGSLPSAPPLASSKISLPIWWKVT